MDLSWQGYPIATLRTRLNHSTDIHKQQKMPQNRTITAKVLQNWSITEVRDAFPAQLRPRRGEKIAPALIAALLEVSTLSKRRVDIIRTALRDAVGERCALSTDIRAATVTVEDVRRVHLWLSRSGTGVTKRPQKKPAAAILKPRRSKRLAARSQDEEVAVPAESPVDNEHTLAQQTLAAWSKSLQDAATASKVTPETPAVSPAVAARTLFDPAPIGSSTVFADDSIRRSNFPTNPFDRNGWDIEPEKESMVPEKLPDTVASRKKELEADMRRLRMLANESRRLAEEYRTKADRHEREALALQAQLEYM